VPDPDAPLLEATALFLTVRTFGATVRTLDVLERARALLKATRRTAGFRPQLLLELRFDGIYKTRSLKVSIHTSQIKFSVHYTNKMPTEEVACQVYEVRHSSEDRTIDEMKAWFRHWTKAWVFQREVSDSGYDHYQGYCSLVKKRRVSEFHAAVRRAEEHNWVPYYCKPQSTNAMEEQRKAGTEGFYAMKADTRVQGPWSDRDVELFIPFPLRGKLDSLYPWQQTIWDSADTREARKINVIIEERGCVGKSTICALIRQHQRGIQLPAMNDPDKLMQIALCILHDRKIRDPKIMLIDIPRAVKQDSLAGMYAACEQIKDGWCYDWRHHWKEWAFHPPQVWVFTNTKPKYAHLSMDRWNLFAVNEADHTLLPLPLGA